MKRRLTMICLVVTAIVCLLAGCKPSGNAAPRPTVDASQQARLRTLRTFFYAMKENDMAAIEAISAPMLLPKIEDWMSAHQPVDCKPDLIHEELFGGSIHLLTKEQSIVDRSLILDCPAVEPRRAVYALTFTRLELKVIEGQWIITDWESVTEEWK